MSGIGDAASLNRGISIISIFAAMNAYIYLYTPIADSKRIHLEISQKLSTYIALPTSEKLSTPSKQQAVTRWTLPRELSTSERQQAFLCLLPHIRQKPFALYYKGSNALPIKRIVADLDGCLVADELLIRIAQTLGWHPSMSEDTYKAMAGHTDFIASFKERVQILQGITASELEAWARSINLAPGIEHFCRFTEGEDIRLDLASSNLTPYVHSLMLRLGANDYISTMPSMNSLEVLDGTLIEPIITDKHKKEYALKAVHNSIGVEHTLTIGDGANDLLMLANTPHALLYHSVLPNSLNIADIVVDLYFRP